MSAALPWRTAWAIARRDLSARFRGLRLLLVCLFLGVGALAAIGTLTGGLLGSHYSDIFAFIVLIIVLTLRPSGLLGERVADRA